MTEVSRLAPAWQEINTPPSRSKALAALRASPLFNSADFSVYERLLYYSYVNHHKRRNSFRIGYRRLSEVTGVSMRYVKKALWKLRGAPYKGELAYEPWVAVKITGRSNMYQVLPLHDDIGTEAHDEPPSERVPLHEYVPLKCPSEGHPHVPLLHKDCEKKIVHTIPSTSLSTSPVLEGDVDNSDVVELDISKEQHKMGAQDPAIGIKTGNTEEVSYNPESPEENTSLQRCIEEGMSDNFVTRGAHFKAYRMPNGAKLIDQKREWAVGNAKSIGGALLRGLQDIIAGRYTLLDKKTNAGMIRTVESGKCLARYEKDFVADVQNFGNRLRTHQDGPPSLDRYAGKVVDPVSVFYTYPNYEKEEKMEGNLNYADAQDMIDQQKDPLRYKIVRVAKVKAMI